jgi:hypothetical protein
MSRSPRHTCWCNGRRKALERRKDREYREDAERRRLGLENVLLELEAIRRLKKLERDVGEVFGEARIYPSEAWIRMWGAELGPRLERLLDFDRRGLVDGSTARTGLEPLEAADSPGE